VFKRKRTDALGHRRADGPDSSMTDDSEEASPTPQQGAVVAFLYPVSGAEPVPLTAAGEYIAVCDAGRAIVTACDVPAPWNLSQRGYSGYAAYLEDPESGDRMRLDMVCVADAHWVAMRHVGPALHHLRLAWVAPVGEGISGPPVLAAQPLPQWRSQVLPEV
jgi:hypothetical protein